MSLENFCLKPSARKHLSERKNIHHRRTRYVGSISSGEGEISDFFTFPPKQLELLVS